MAIVKIRIMVRRPSLSVKGPVINIENLIISIERFIEMKRKKTYYVPI